MNKIVIGTKNIKKRITFLWRLEKITKGNTHKVITTTLPPKLPTNEKIWIKYLFPDRAIDGINQGKPVKTDALKYSNKDKKSITITKDEALFLVNSLANKKAKPQKIANKLGNKITANGMK